MSKINKNNLYNIEGGANISGTLINAVTKAIYTLYNFGQSVGSAIRRVAANKKCPV